MLLIKVVSNVELFGETGEKSQKRKVFEMNVKLF